MMEDTKYRMFLFIFFIALFLFEKGICEATTNPDSLKYITHSFVKIKTSEGTVIYIDPYGVNEFADSADIVLITHEHSDHNDLTRIKQKSTCQVIRAANAIQGGVYQTFTIGTISIKAVAAYNGNHPKSSSVGYVVEFNGIKLYHAGDTGKIPEMADLASQNITYALLPMDGTYTVTPEVATEEAAMIQAQHDIPIHTMPPPDTYNDAFVARFTSPNKLVVRPGSSIELNAGTTSVKNDATLPLMFTLSQNYPNPFNPSTQIDFALQKSSFVSLKIFDALGREISTLVSGYLSEGNHTRHWNAGSMQSGVYFYRLQAGNFIETKKLVLLK
jgi:L-ascorbate metabolism protein UlaG (beta-lactamase superfamily)